MRKEKKLTYSPRDIGISWAFFVFPHAVLLLPPALLSFVPPLTLSPFPPCEQSFTAGCCGGGGVIIRRHSSFVVCHLRLCPPCPCLLFIVRCSPFHCPLSLAASTCNPPHEQWLAGLGWVLAIRHCSSITHPPCKQRWVLLVPSWVVPGVGVPS